jgi:hypothetical protein
MSVFFVLIRDYESSGFTHFLTSSIFLIEKTMSDMLYVVNFLMTPQFTVSVIEECYLILFAKILNGEPTLFSWLFILDVTT